MEYYFTRSKIALDQKLIEKINLATKTLDIAIYSLTKNEIVDAIIAAKHRGVIVRIICDQDQAASRYEAKDIENLKNNNIPIKVNAHSGLMHLKISIIDQKIITLGSYNYSKAATTSNDEVLAIVESETDAQAFTAQFEKMWHDNTRFKSIS
ncbi:MAG: phospholipase D-like domain-containing protein [Cellulosilyticaceae bacterium]